MPNLSSKVLLFLLTIFILFSPPTEVFAGKDAELFDSKQDYDIYFYSSESSTSVLENVNILGFKSIGGKEFLIIRSKGFKLTEESGFIDFESVIAILPDSHFRVRKSDGIRLRRNY